MKNQDLKQVEQTLNSLDHMSRAKAHPFLYHKIMEGMKIPRKDLVRPSLVWKVAASIALLIGLNFGYGIYQSKKNASSVLTNQEGYFTNNLYNY